MKPITIDERYQVVEDAIMEAFVLLMVEKEVSKISVSDVIKKAGIVRSTFYNHYENIPDLIVAVEDKTIGDIFNLMSSFHAQNNKEVCKSFFLAMCNYTKSNPYLSQLLSTPTTANRFFEKSLTMFHNYVKKAATNAAPRKNNREVYSYAIACSIGATIGVLHKWSHDNCEIPEEQIAELLTQTFLSGILPFLS